MKEFFTRTITAFVLIVIVFFLIKYTSTLGFSLVIFAILCLGADEILKLTQPVTYSRIVIFINALCIASWFTFKKPDLLLAIFLVVLINGLYFLFSINKKVKLDYFIRDFGVHFIIVFYLFIPIYFLLELKNIGPNYIFFLIFVIAVGDSGAYFVGSAIGKHKIYPIASPNKSLEGLIAAILTAGLTGWLSILIFPLPVNLWMAIGSGAIIGLLSQLSDPIESLFKRAGKKKDSGSIFPGHGGILDRIDSYILCAPSLFFIIKYLWN